MRLPGFLITALFLPLLVSAQVFPPTADVAKSISILTSGMQVQAITVDSTGNVYLAGTSTSGFPGAITRLGPRGDSDLFVIKTNAAGDQIIYATAIGGSSSESLRAIRVDANGNLYGLANTQSTDFPNTTQFTPGFPIGGLIFKLNATGTALTYSTQLGSRTSALAFDIDNTGAAYIAGSANANDITTTPNVIKSAPITGAGANDYYGYIVKLSPDGTTFQIATYYGVADKSVEAISVRSNGILILANGTLALLNNALTQQTASVATNLAPANMAFDAAGNIYLSGTSTLPAAGFALRRYTSTLTQNLDKTYPFVSTTTPPRIAVAGNGRIYLFGQPISAQVFQTKNATQTCSANIAAPNGTAGVVLTDNGGGVIGAGGAAIPPDQGVMILDTNGEVLHASFLTTNVSQTAVASSNGRVYTAATQTLFTTPDRTTWNGIVRFNQELVPVEKTSPACLVHGAYFTNVPVSPGALMTIFGNHLGPGATPTAGTSFQLVNNRVPTTLAGVSVTVDNKPAPMLYVYDKQINFIIPWTVRTDGAAVPVCVSYDGTNSCFQATTGPGNPGAFQCGAVACALNQDFSINQPNNPAAPGSTVQIFMTGFGTVEGTLVDGGVTSSIQRIAGIVTASTEPPPTGGCGLFACNSAAAGFQTVPVGFAGAAPSLVQGVNQINLQIPADMPSGLQTFTINYKQTETSPTVSTTVKLQIR